MTERLALVVSSFDELREKLTQYTQGEAHDIADFYQSQIKNRLSQFGPLIEEGNQEFVKNIINDRKLNKLAQLWSSGIEIDWQLLYPNQKPQRIYLRVC